MFRLSRGGITVLTTFDRISLFHTLKPFLFYNSLRPGAFRFKLTDSVDECLGRDRNRKMVVLRLPEVPGADPMNIMHALRLKYPRLVFFNDGAAAGTNNFEYLPLVDRFIVKSLFRDRDDYLRPLYRRRLFTDYYHREYGVTDPDIETRPPDGEADREGNPSGDVNPEDLKKLRMGWNIGVGDFPREDLRQRAGVFTARVVHPKAARLFFRRGMPAFTDLNDGDGVPEIGAAESEETGRDIPVHARLGSLPAPSVNKQREIFLELASKDRRFVTGRAPKRQYDEEMRCSMMTLSPFGWGEVCFRDFEAVFSGTLILKPDMGHLVTWPDLYRPGETYVPLSWDGKDLLEKVEYYLEHPRERGEIIRNARHTYRTALSGLPDRFIEVMKEAFG